MDDDPEYYQSLSLRLEEIIQKYQGKWEELVQQLWIFRDGMERDKTQQNEDLGLSEIEGPFYRSLMAEITKVTGEDTMDEETHQRVLDLTKELVSEFQKATQIVGFFQKDDEIKSVAKKIKRSLIEKGFDDPELRKEVTDAFMALGKRHFR